ncbi:MAG: hypothetical protein QM780_09450 [Hyphomicrobium sp.]|uniref:hypothetical protein n=1 Tax=Hyphomicrobium sp. TaxID=82 RepID=UPI0039E3373A
MQAINYQGNKSCIDRLRSDLFRKQLTVNGEHRKAMKKRPGGYGLTLQGLIFEGTAADFVRKNRY